MLAMPASSLRSRPPRILRLAILVVTAALGPTLAPSQSVASTATGLSLEQPNRGDWPLVGRDYGNQHYSPLRQINASTIERLAPRALLQLQLEGASPGAEAAPVFVDGRMYTTTNYDVVTAFDMRHRTQLWRYVPKLGVAKPCCGPVNRGVAVANGMVYLGTLDSRVIALDQDSGTVRWQVVTNDPDSAYSITMAPTVVGDRVIVGSSGGEFATRGNVTAYDARTGAQLWRWYAIPSPEEGGWWGKWTPKAPTGESLDRDIAQERADSARYADSWKGGGGGGGGGGGRRARGGGGGGRGGGAARAGAARAGGPRARGRRGGPGGGRPSDRAAPRGPGAEALIRGRRTEGRGRPGLTLLT